MFVTVEQDFARRVALNVERKILVPSLFFRRTGRLLPLLILHDRVRAALFKQFKRPIETEFGKFFVQAPRFFECFAHFGPALPINRAVMAPVPFLRQNRLVRDAQFHRFAIGHGIVAGVHAQRFGQAGFPG